MRDQDQDIRRRLPRVDDIVAAVAEPAGVPARLAAPAIRAVLDDWRSRLASSSVPSTDQTLALIHHHLVTTVAELKTTTGIINATGVLLHTNLGRAPLPDSDAIALPAQPVEFDLSTGQRGRRFARLEAALTALTGAEAALVVNNNAAAVTVTLAALSSHDRPEVIVCRGELVEIGGGFRVPEVIETSGATLVEVGTTNKSYPADYERVVSAGTAALLKMHPSNYTVTGFTNEVSLAELASISDQAEVSPPVLYDLGSGLLDSTTPWLPAEAADKSVRSWIRDEPAVRQSLEAGADLVMFSGDKLLGGPQAGIICGRQDLVGRVRRHPLVRAVRFDALRARALERVLDHYLEDDAAKIPFWAMASASVASLTQRAEKVSADIGGLETVETTATPGAGSAPETTIPSVGVAFPASLDPETVARMLRESRPAVIGVIRDGRLIVDLRSVPADRDAVLRDVLAAAWGELANP